MTLQRGEKKVKNWGEKLDKKTREWVEQFCCNTIDFVEQGISFPTDLLQFKGRVSNDFKRTLANYFRTLLLIFSCVPPLESLVVFRNWRPIIDFRLFSYRVVNYWIWRQMDFIVFSFSWSKSWDLCEISVEKLDIYESCWEKNPMKWLRYPKVQ